MADFGILIQYKLLLTANELRLLQKALRGNLETPEEKAEALALQEKFAQEKHTQLRQATDEAAKTVENIARAKK